MIDWLPGVERIQIEGCTGPGSYIGAPWRLVLHTIEGGSIDNAIGGVFKPNPCYCPHFSVSLAKRRIVQHVRLTWASAALANDQGGVETNRENAIQVELEGYAKDAATRTPAELEFLGEFIAMLVRAGVPLNLDHVAQFVGAEAGTIAVKNSRYRMTSAQWQAFDGICGHQHVPENEHWDPGHLDVQTAVDHAKSVLGSLTTSTPTPAPEEDIMATKAELEQVVAAQADRIIAAIPKPAPVDDGLWMGTFQAEGKVYIVVNGVRYHVPGGATEGETNQRLELLQRQGFDNRGVQDAALSALPEAPFALTAA